MGKLRKACILD